MVRDVLAMLVATVNFFLVENTNGGLCIEFDETLWNILYN